MISLCFDDCGLYDIPSNSCLVLVSRRVQTGLENRSGGNSTVGSNPTLSATSY